MQFQVTEIEFDFEMEDDDEFPSQDYQNSIIEETLQKVWEVDDEEDLTDTISDCFGWCIKSIDYRIIPSMELELAWSDEFKIVEDSSNFVHIMDGEQTVRLTMPRKTLDDIVKQIHSRVDYHF